MTLHNCQKNYKRRYELYLKGVELETEITEMREKAYECDSDEECFTMLDVIENEMYPVLRDIQKSEYALCIPETRNQWFKDFVSSFPDGTMEITRNQAAVFSRYSHDSLENWEHFRICRVGNRYIQLHEGGKMHIIKVITLEHLK